MKKNSSLEKRALSSTFANVLLFAVQFIQSIAVVPFLLQYWGKEKYGIWLGIYAFFNLVQIFDLGHQTYVGNEFNRFFHSDKKKAQVILGSGVLASIGIGSFELLFTILIVVTGVSGDLIGIPKGFSESYVSLGLLVLVVMWALSGSLGGLLVRIILPIGMMAKFIYISLIIKIATLMILLFAAFAEWSLLAVCIGFSIAYLIYSYGLFFYIYKIMPDFFPWWAGASWQVGWQNFRNSLAITFNSTLEQFSTNGLIMLISNFLGAGMIPMFTTMRTVANTALQGTGMILNPLYPDMIRFHANNEPYKLHQTILANWIITGLLINIGFLVLMWFIEPMYIWWTRGELIYDHGLFIVLVMSVVIANYNRGMVIYLTGTNHIKSMTFISITRFILTAGISFVFIKSYGLESLGWALLIAELACTAWIIWFSQKLLKSIGLPLPSNLLIASVLPILVVGISLTVYFYHLLPIEFTLIGGILILLFTYGYLAKFLSSEVRLRFQKLIFYKFQ